MKSSQNLRKIFFALLVLIPALCFPFSTATSQSSDSILMIQLSDDTINPVTAEYIIDAIDRAEAENAECLIIKLDTPGGLLNSTRLIVKHMLKAEVPVVVYIAPGGSRAGSAGVFITYASHIAAMAPSTNIGAAHPVQIGDNKNMRQGEWGELRELLEELRETKKVIKEAEEAKDKTGEAADKLEQDDSPMESKILNDTVAFIKAIAKERDRNVEWGIESVTQSASITADEALEKGVVEFIAENDEDLLRKIDGKVIKLASGERTLQTAGERITKIAMDARQQFFNILANPNIAYFLMILGFYGLLYEITHPGIGVPGILGTVFLILAFYSLQTLPTNFAGVALMVLGLTLLISEAFVPGFGLLTLGGLVCLVLGSLLLFESADPVMRVSKAAIITLSGTTALLTVYVLQHAVRHHRAKVQGGQEGLIGEKGEASSEIVPGKKGRVFVHGELWRAISDENISKGDSVVVLEVDGLTIKVGKPQKEEG